MYCNSRHSRSRHTSDPFPGVASICSAQLRGPFRTFLRSWKADARGVDQDRGSSGLARRWDYPQFAGSVVAESLLKYCAEWLTSGTGKGPRHETRWLKPKQHVEGSQAGHLGRTFQGQVDHLATF